MNIKELKLKVNEQKNKARYPKAQESQKLIDSRMPDIFFLKAKVSKDADTSFQGQETQQMQLKDYYDEEQVAHLTPEQILKAISGLKSSIADIKQGRLGQIQSGGSNMGMSENEQFRYLAEYFDTQKGNLQ